MPHYPPERKLAVLQKMAQPGVCVPELAKAEGISEPTLYNWRKEARAAGRLLPDANTGPKGWSALDRFNALLESAAMPEAEVAAYCREKGIYPEQIAQWKQAATAACAAAPAIDAQEAERMRKQDKMRIAQLEKELARKEKALAEAAALMVLRKNLASILGEEDA